MTHVWKYTKSPKEKWIQNNLIFSNILKAFIQNDQD